MENSRKQRESNYELLRMIAGMAIIVLHYNFHPSGGGAMTQAAGFSYYVLMLLETVCAGAVNIFILLSGFFGNRSKTIKTGKLAALLLQTMFFSFMFCVLYSYMNSQWSIRSLIASLIPANYFVILYIVLMLIAPFINVLIDNLDQRQFTLMTAIMFTAFSLYSAGVDVFKEITGSAWNGLSPIGLEGSMAGYTIVNFVTVYVIGAWLARDGRLKNCKTSTLATALLLLIGMDIIWRIVLPGTAWNYNNPVIIASAVTVFVLFGTKSFYSRAVNELAPAAFTCFLIQANLLAPVVSRLQGFDSSAAILIILIGSVAGIYFVAYIAMKLWNLITRPVFRASIDKIPMIKIG